MHLSFNTVKFANFEGFKAKVGEISETPQDPVCVAKMLTDTKLNVVLLIKSCNAA